jgi:MATE family multidrug resistance protein
MALVLGLALVALQAPIGTVSIWLRGGSADVAAAARTYYDWRIWSAPFALANYALLGWLIGLGFAGRAFLVQIVLNSVNIALSMLLVLRLGLGVEGVAVASLIAEAVGTMLGLLLCVGHLRRSATSTRLAQIMDKGELRRAFGLNTNIMVRSLCLLFAFTYFTAQSARMGDVTLAANAILLDLFGLAAYFLDGFSHSAETFTGQAIGARRKDRLMEAFWLSILWASVLAVLASAILLVGGTTMIDIMTTSNPVRTQARGFLIWAALSPLFGYVAFLFDGIYAGATRGSDMRNMMLASLIVFLGSTWVLVPAFGNHGLWAALMVFFAVRGITLGLRFPAVVAQAIAPPTRATH